MQIDCMCMVKKKSDAITCPPECPVLGRLCPSGLHRPGWTVTETRSSPSHWISIGPVHFAEKTSWNTVPADLLWEKNTVLAEKTSWKVRIISEANGIASASQSRINSLSCSVRQVIFWCCYKQDDGAKFSLLNSAIAPIICQGTGHRDTGQWRLSQPASQDSDLTWGYAACAVQWGGADLVSRRSQLCPAEDPGLHCRWDFERALAHFGFVCCVSDSDKNWQDRWLIDLEQPLKGVAVRDS